MGKWGYNPTYYKGSYNSIYNWGPTLYQMVIFDSDSPQSDAPRSFSSTSQETNSCTIFMHHFTQPAAVGMLHDTSQQACFRMDALRCDDRNLEKNSSKSFPEFSPTLPETNSHFAPEKRPKPKRKFIFQTFIFRCYVTCITL